MPEQTALALDEFGAERSAVISDDGLYRYRLERRWAPGHAVTWVMLNPSTADAEIDDPTLRRITGFSRRMGFGRLIVVNLYAFRATEPRDLWRATDPVGPDNDEHLRDALTGHEVVVAWGAHARPDRIARFLQIHRDAPGAGRLHALTVTGSGQPGHPLYVRSDRTPAPWEPPDTLEWKPAPLNTPPAVGDV